MKAAQKLAWQGLLLLGATLSTAVLAAPARPNFVLLVADDWGFTDVGAYGGEIATPHLDALAARGVRFSNFHVSASCAPTRSMLLTGVDHHRNGVGNLRETMPLEHLGKPGYLGSLAPNVVTVATLLRDAGYRTYVSGKWNVGSEPHNLPPQRGFDRSIVLGDTGSDHWDPRQRYLPHSAHVEWFEDGKPAQMPKSFYSSEYFVDRAIGHLRADQASDRPFFAYLGFQANHVPLQAPRALIEKYRGRYDAGWAWLRTQRRDRAAELGLIPKNTPMVSMSSTLDWSTQSDKQRRHQARSMEVYAAMAEAMDQQVGRLIDYLKASGQYNNTVFIFLSDNGAEGSDYAQAQLWLATQYSQELERLGGPGAYAIPGPSWASAMVAPLAGYKFYAGEGGIRVPLIIAGVAGAQPQRIQRGLAHVNDIVPTLLEMARVPLPGDRYRGQAIEPIAGRSLLPVLRGEAERTYPEDQPIGYELSGNQALFKGDWKLVKNLPPVGDGQWRLHNLMLDPGETRDRREHEPERFRSMVADYERWAATHGVLAMPEGYSPARQAMINSFVNYWIPSYRWHALAAIGTLVALTLLWRRRRRP